MAAGHFKMQRKSEKYKNVYLYTKGDQELWLATLGKKQKYFDTERAAAKFIDLTLIKKGKEPVNILVRK